MCIAIMTDPRPEQGMTGLRAWLSAAEAVGSGADFRWPAMDARGSPATAVRAQPGATPAVTTSGGRPAVSFTGAGMLLPGALMPAGGYTAVFVLQRSSLSPAQGLLGSTDGGANVLSTTVGGLGADHDRTTGGNSSSGKIVAGAPQIAALQWVANEGFTFAFGDGIDVTVPYTPAPAAITGSFVIGGTDQTVTNGYSGLLFEALVFEGGIIRTPEYGWLIRRMRAAYGIGS